MSSGDAGLWIGADCHLELVSASEARAGALPIMAPPRELSAVAEMPHLHCAAHDLGLDLCLFTLIK